uniref:Uncharacterized protein n=1 Tax=Plectus sambesii TaxID=2011161 RepID=A0A914WS24_9BILA
MLSSTCNCHCSGSAAVLIQSSPPLYVLSSSSWACVVERAPLDELLMPPVRGHSCRFISPVPFVTVHAFGNIFESCSTSEPGAGSAVEQLHTNHAPFEASLCYCQSRPGGFGRCPRLASLEHPPFYSVIIMAHHNAQRILLKWRTTWRTAGEWGQIGHSVDGGTTRCARGITRCARGFAIERLIVAVRGETTASCAR